ncbi:MAG: glycosyl hydrolase [Mariniphaga sp.]
MRTTLTGFLIFFFFASLLDAQTLLNKSEFQNPPTSSKVHVWWHWMGGNITKDGITKDLEAMKAQGVVQATIFNIGEIYTKKVDVPKVKFNSPEWIEMFRWALKEANRLGITIGIQTIDGFATVGGSWITPELSMKQYVWTKTSIDGGKEINIKLQEPIKVQNFYRDEAVVAFPMHENTNSFKEANPAIDVNKVSTENVLFDGNPKSEIDFKKGHVVDVRFNADFTANKLVLYPHLSFSWDLPLVDKGRVKLFFALSTSNDGNTYTKVSDLQFIGVNKAVTASFPATKAKYFRLELVRTSFVYFNTLPVAEFELLKDSEMPLFQPHVTSFFEKTASVYDLNENALDANTKNTIQPVSENSIVDVTSYMSADGTLKWNAPKGRWQIIRFGYTSTGVMVDPASPEGLGLEVDKMDTAALNVHINSYAKKLVEAAGGYKGNTLKFFIMDSWEAQFQTWSKGFAKEFKNRRGYSILPWIPVLCGETIGNMQLSEAFLFDFRKTIADLIDQNFYKHFAELSHRNQMEYHGEAIYGGWGAYPPMDALKSNEYIDMPMTEFWANANSKNLLDYQPANNPVTNMPTSSALAFSKQIIGSEAYTGNAHYSEAPGDLKPFGDAAFCSGVNQIILHSYIHQPFDLKPGMTLGKFGGHYNRNNPVWEFNQDWLKYQSRVQYILQKGEPVVDVLFYTGDQLPWFYTKSFVNDLPYGIRPNACNIDLLNHKIKVIDGKLSLGAKQRFSLLLLHNSTKMEFSTLKRIADLVKSGAVVYGPKPLEMLSVTDLKYEVAAFNQLAGEVWGNTNENSYGKGKMISGKPLEEVFKQLNVISDLNTNTANPKEIMYIHKKLEELDIYFVFNQQTRALNRELLFRVTGKTPEIWNAENGAVIKPAIYSMEKNQTRIPVSFKPYESKIFIFNNEVPAQFIQQVSLAGKEIFPQQQLADTSIQIPQAAFNHGNFSFTSELTGEYAFTTNENKVIKTKLTQPKILDLGNTKIRIEFFPISDEVIQPVEVTNLKSLTEFDNPAIKYFAGKAKYTINFNSPDFVSGSDSILLHLGNLSATSQVILNGKLLAYPWQPNTRLDVSGLLKAENKLEITVANVCRNRFIGDLIQYGSVKSLWTTSPIETILNKGMPLKPSGLMGPLKLIGYFSSNTSVNSGR